MAGNLENHKLREKPDFASDRRSFHPDPHRDGLDLKRVILIFRRHWMIILTTVGLLTALTGLVSSQLTPRYTATAAVMFEPHEIRAVNLENLESEDQTLPEDARIATWIRDLESGSHLRRIVRELGLINDPEFNPFLAPEEMDTILAKLKQWLPTSRLASANVAEHPNTASGADITKQSRERQLQVITSNLQNRLQVSQGGTSYVVSISFTSLDPEKAARITNAVAKLYIDSQVERKLAMTTRASEWLAGRVQQLREELLASERAIEEYRAANELLDGKGTTLDGQQLATLNMELIAARTARAEREARLQRARELGTSGGLESMGEVIASPTIISLRQQETALLRQQAEMSREFGMRHPKILQLDAEIQNLQVKIGLEIRNIIRNLENEVAVARSREQALEASFEEAKSRSAVSNQAGIQLNELQREAEASRSLYGILLARMKEVKELQTMLQPNAKVISEAMVPEEPSFPKPMLMTEIGFTVSLVLGALFAFVADSLDSGIHTKRELEQALGLPCLGFIPKVRDLRRGQKLHWYLHKKPKSIYGEAIRALQRKVLALEAHQPAQIILVTSTLPGEGKTSLAVSLAASAASTGRSSLVIDLDLRHPSVAHAMSQSPSADLIDFLLDQATLEDVICPDSIVEKLAFISVKSPAARPLDLLESMQLAALLAELRRRYDCIILDAPPALGVIDAKVAARLADTVLFAVQWEETRAEIALNGLETLIEDHVGVTGLVLTQADIRRHAKYGYGDVGEYYGKHTKYYVN